MDRLSMKRAISIEWILLLAKLDWLMNRIHRHPVVSRDVSNIVLTFQRNPDAKMSPIATIV